MIEVKYNNDGILVDLKNVQDFHPNSPYSVKFRKHVSGEIQWSTELPNYSFATFPNTEMYDVEITDNKEVPIYIKRWDIIEHGSYFYKAIWVYCKGLISNGKLPNGLVIGTHDGEFGEWVPTVINKLSKMVLVEASEKQYNKLYQNYKKNDMVTFVNELVTPDGGDVEFFEGGEGYTNSVVESVIKHWEKDEIKSTTKNSISINKLIEDNFPNGLDWLHLDVEGLDDKLIMGIKNTDLIPKLVIFEDYNLSQERKDVIYKFFENLGYKNHSQHGVCMSLKKI